MCFRFHTLNPSKAAAGSTMASSSVSSVRVRSVNRHFLDMLNLVQPVPFDCQTIKNPPSWGVKATQTIVKSCKKHRALAFTSSTKKPSGCLTPSLTRS